MNQECAVLARRDASTSLHRDEAARQIHVTVTCTRLAISIWLLRPRVLFLSLVPVFRDK